MLVCRRYAESSIHITYCHSVVYFYIIIFVSLLFLSNSLLNWHPSFPCAFRTLLSVHNCNSSCPWLSSQCLMVCRSLWPLAVCLCTPCTCPSLTSNSTMHIHSVSHSVTRRNAETHTCLAVIHTHKPNWIPLFKPNKLLTLVFFLFLCTPLFYELNSWAKHCPEPTPTQQPPPQQVHCAL